MSSPAIQNYFQQFLGRAPSAGELQFLNDLVERNDISLGEVQQLVQGLPEANQRRLGEQGAYLNQQLASGEQASLDNVLNRAIPQANARFAALGRQNSSAFESSVAQQVGQQAGNLASRRQDALANFYGQGLSNVANQYMAMSAGAQQRGYQQRDMKTRRAWDIEDYYRQKNDQADYENAHDGWNAITPMTGVQIGTNLAAAGLSAYGNYAGQKQIAKSIASRGLY